MKNAVFLRTRAYFFFIFDPPMAQTKALTGAITEIPCSVVTVMSINSSKMNLGSIRVNSTVCYNYVKLL